MSNPIIDIESNDSINSAIATNLNTDNSTAVIEGAINLDLENNPGVDNSEDVDFYSFDLSAGDTIAVDVDAMQFDSVFEAAITLFDAEGNTLISDVGESVPLPEEIFFSEYDPHFEYNVEQDGTYYLGVASYPNYNPAFTNPPGDTIDLFGTDTLEGLYDPFTTGSGTGSSVGEYTINLGLNGAEVAVEETTEETTEGTTESNGDLVISFDTIEGTYGEEFDVEEPGLIVSQSLVETTEEGGAALAFSLSAEGEFPSGGVEMIIDSDAPLGDYLSSINFPPFSPGTEVLEPVIDPETGEATGIKFLMQAPNVVLSLPVLDNEEVNDPRQVTYTLESGAGYTVDGDMSNTVTFYDTFDQVPELTVIPEVSLSIDNSELIETQGSPTTLTFELSEAPPPEGTLVYVDSGVEGTLGDFNVLNAEVTGGSFPSSNGITSGFYFEITEQTASITLNSFPDAIDEGIEALDFTLQPGAGYTIAEDADTASLTIADTPDSSVRVSYSIEPESLVEAEGTVSTHTFSLSAPPPEEGVTVTVTAEGLSEFDPAAIETTGITGEVEIEDGEPPVVSFTITEQDATINLPVADDGEAEGLEEAVFTLNPGEDYGINEEESTATFTIADSNQQLPVVDIELQETEEDVPVLNDTISQAQNLNLSADNANIVVNGAIAETFGLIDASEDVDLYQFELKAGKTVAIDLDSESFEDENFEVPQQLDAQLRLLDSSGEELILVDNATAPDDSEDNSVDPYLEFTATEDATYYVGVSQLGNDTYNPNEAASGSGIIIPEEGINVGDYQLNVDLTSEDDGDDPAFEPVFGSLDGNTIEVEGSNQLIFAGESDDLIDLTQSDGNNRAYADGGDDTLVLGQGDRILAGAGDDSIFATKSGNNTITGGAGADSFWIASAKLPDSANTITDFTAGEDVIGVAGLGIGYSDLDIYRY